MHNYRNWILVVLMSLLITNLLEAAMKDSEKTKITEILKAGNDLGQFQMVMGSMDEEQKICNFLDINGTGFKNPDALSNLPLEVLTLAETQINSLDFLNDGIIASTLKTLMLTNNKELKNYTSLKLSAIYNLHIADVEFCDTTLISPHTYSITLKNTSVKQLDFPNNKNIISLTLVGNKLIADYSPINKLFNLSRLEIDGLVGVNLNRLMKLQSFTLKTQKAEIFPELPEKEFKYICIFRCDKLLSIENLKKRKVKKVTIISSQDQLAQFSPTLMTMEIQNLEIIDNDTNVTVVENLKKINGLQKIRFNNKQLLKIDSKWNSKWKQYKPMHH